MIVETLNQMEQAQSQTLSQVDLAECGTQQLVQINESIQDQLNVIEKQLRLLDLSVNHSALTKQQQKLVNTFVKEFKLCISDDYTILITNASDGKCKRTFKYMYALLNRIPILSFDWIHASLDQHALVDFEEFQLKPASNDTWIFQSLLFYLPQTLISPGRDEIQILLESGGGEIVEEEGDAVITLVDPNCKRAAGISSMWILDCASSLKLLDITAYVRK